MKKIAALLFFALCSSAIADGLIPPNGLPINGGTLLGPVNFQGTGTAGYDATIGVTGGGSLVDRGIGYFQAGNIRLETYDGTIQFGTDSVPGATEYYLASAGVAGSNPTLTCINISASGNVSCSFAAQGTGGFAYGNSNGQLFAIDDVGAATTNWLHIQPGTSSLTPTLYSPVNLALNVPATYTENFQIAGNTGLQVKLFGSGSFAGNYIAVGDSNSGSLAHIECLNVTTTVNVSCYLRAQGQGAIYFANGNSGTMMTVASAGSASTTDYLKVTAPTTAGNPVILASNSGTYLSLPESVVVGSPTGSNECALGCINASHVYSNGTELVPGAAGAISSSTYASLPTASSGNTGVQYFVTDYNTVFISNGSKWLPADGRLIIYKKTGSEGTPLATLTGTTASQFTITGGFPTIPANLLSVNSRMIVSALVRKVGTGGTYTLSLRLGTAGTTSDPAIVAYGGITNATNLDTNLSGDAMVSTSTNYTTSNYVITNSSGTANAGADRNFNFNIASINTVSVDISAANTADTFNLIRLIVEVWP